MGPFVEVSVSLQILKGIIGQCVFQLSVMYALVFHIDAVFQIPKDATVLHGTIIFNTFVLMQLVNQVRPMRLLATSGGSVIPSVLLLYVNI